MSGALRGDWRRRIAAEAVRRGGGCPRARRPAERRRWAVVQPRTIPGPDHAKWVDVSRGAPSPFHHRSLAGQTHAHRHACPERGGESPAGSGIVTRRILRKHELPPVRRYLSSCVHHRPSREGR